MLSWFRGQVEQRAVLLSDRALCVTLKEVHGDCTVSTRKANKKVAFFDLSVTLTWESREPVEGDVRAKGELKLTEFSSASDEDEYIVTATVEGSGARREELRCAAARLKGSFVKAMRELTEEMLSQ